MCVAALEDQALRIESSEICASDTEPTMYSTPEIFLQADLAYHRDRIRAQLAEAGGRKGTPVRHRHLPRSLRRVRSVVSHAR
jgi:hypothetical protein